MDDPTEASTLNNNSLGSRIYDIYDHFNFGALGACPETSQNGLLVTDVVNFLRHVYCTSHEYLGCSNARFI